MDIDVVLSDKLTELDREIAEITAPPEQGAEISFGKRVGDGTAMAVDRLTQVATHERMLQVRADVVRAQAKRADGSYGLCDRCGQQIAPERLEALPWATTDVTCA